MYELPIERGKLREFALATQSTNPAYLEDRPVVPPTFLTTAFLTWEPDGEPGVDDLGFDAARVLHGEEEFTFHGPLPRAGQTLRVASRLGERTVKEGRRGGTMTIAEIVHEFEDEHGNKVATQRTVLVETAKAPEAG